MYKCDVYTSISLKTFMSKIFILHMDIYTYILHVHICDESIRLYAHTGKYIFYMCTCIIILSVHMPKNQYACRCMHVHTEVHKYVHK